MREALIKVLLRNSHCQVLPGDLYIRTFSKRILPYLFKNTENELKFYTFKDIHSQKKSYFSLQKTLFHLKDIIQTTHA